MEPAVVAAEEAAAAVGAAEADTRPAESARGERYPSPGPGA